MEKSRASPLYGDAFVLLYIKLWTGQSVYATLYIAYTIVNIQHIWRVGMKTSNLSGVKKSSTNKRANGAPPKPRATPKTPTKEQMVSDFQVDLADS